MAHYNVGIWYFSENLPTTTHIKIRNHCGVNAKVKTGHISYPPSPQLSAALPMSGWGPVATNVWCTRSSWSHSVQAHPAFLHDSGPVSSIPLDLHYSTYYIHWLWGFRTGALIGDGQVHPWSLLKPTSFHLCFFQRCLLDSFYIPYGTLIGGVHERGSPPLIRGVRGTAPKTILTLEV